MRHIIWEEYPTLFPHNEMLLAHLWQECPMLTAECGYKEGQSRNDYGYGYGISQHNIHIRSDDWMKKRGLYYRPSNPSYTTIVREEFAKDHKWARSWQGQLRHYLNIQKGCMEKYKSVYTCVRRHNWNAGDSYYNKVVNNVFIVRKLMAE